MKGQMAEKFEELHVYQRGRELVNAIYAATREGIFSRDFGLSDQIRRAGVSVLSNIAEGFERGTTTEFVQFLYIAKGSFGELRAQIQIASDQGYVSKVAYQQIDDMTRRVSAMLSNLIDHIQSSGYKGEKTSRPQRRTAERSNQSQDNTV